MSFHMSQCETAVLISPLDFGIDYGAGAVRFQEFRMPGDPKECREHAKNCLRLAAESPSPLAKARFEDLANTWMKLATDLEQTKALVDHWNNEDAKKTG
jgi:hypothetical protein